MGEPKVDDVDEVIESFDDLPLHENLLRGIYSYGFEKPSAIQMRAIVPCTKGYDVIAQAQSGTGKTATFAISCLQQIDVNRACTQALILGPTRELAQQIQKVINSSNTEIIKGKIRSCSPLVTTWALPVTLVLVATT